MWLEQEVRSVVQWISGSKYRRGGLSKRRCGIRSLHLVSYAMPLFSRKNFKREGEFVKNGSIDTASKGNDNELPIASYNNAALQESRNDVPIREIVMTETEKPKLIFHCQQAQGSPTGLISGFSNVKELYEKIAECYDFTADEVSVHFFLQIQIVESRHCSCFV